MVNSVSQAYSTAYSQDISNGNYYDDTYSTESDTSGSIWGVLGTAAAIGVGIGMTRHGGKADLSDNFFNNLCKNMNKGVSNLQDWICGKLKLNTKATEETTDLYQQAKNILNMENSADKNHKTKNLTSDIETMYSQIGNKNTNKAKKLENLNTLIKDETDTKKLIASLKENKDSFKIADAFSVDDKGNITANVDTLSKTKQGERFMEANSAIFEQVDGKWKQKENSVLKKENITKFLASEKVYYDKALTKKYGEIDHSTKITNIIINSNPKLLKFLNSIEKITTKDQLDNYLKQIDNNTHLDDLAKKIAKLQVLSQCDNSIKNQDVYTSLAKSLGDAFNKDPNFKTLCGDDIEVNADGLLSIKPSEGGGK